MVDIPVGLTYRETCYYKEQKDKGDCMFGKVWLILVMSVLLFGCSSRLEKMEAVCRDAMDASQMTEDCSKMAAFLKPVSEKYQMMISDVRDNVAESERNEFVNAVSKCNRAFLEIQTGTCANDPEVKAVLP